MKVFRLTRVKYARLLNGEGAAKHDNRWNSKGTSVVYTSDSRALAMAEVAVHIPLNQLPGDFEMVEIALPQSAKVYTVTKKELPKHWNKLPYSRTVQQLGDQFITDNQYLALRVPSAVVIGDYNILLNPKHSDFGSVRIISASPFMPDFRLYG